MLSLPHKLGSDRFARRRLGDKIYWAERDCLSIEELTAVSIATQYIIVINKALKPPEVL